MSYPNYEHHRVFADIRDERARQDKKWGPQNHPDGTASDEFNVRMSEQWKEHVDRKAAEGSTDWISILFEEAYEASCETDPVRLRAEVVQIAAVAVAWLEAIDRRTSPDEVIVLPQRPTTVGGAIIALVPGAEGAGVKP